MGLSFAKIYTDWLFVVSLHIVLLDDWPLELTSTQANKIFHINIIERKNTSSAVVKSKLMSNNRNKAAAAIDVTSSAAGSLTIMSKNVRTNVRAIPTVKGSQDQSFSPSHVSHLENAAEAVPTRDCDRPVKTTVAPDPEQGKSYSFDARARQPPTKKELLDKTPRDINLTYKAEGT